MPAALSELGTSDVAARHLVYPVRPFGQMHPFLIGVRHARGMFDCPRCGSKDIDAPFYGPCADCRTALNASMYKEPTERRDAAAYVPKMNVTPNAVALKADD